MTTKNEDFEQSPEAENVDESKDITIDRTAPEIVKKYMYFSIGAGLIPVPVIDTGAVFGVQLKMLGRLSKHYGIEFKENRVKVILSALLGSLASGSLTRSAFTRFITSIPILGRVGSFSMALYAGAATYAIGKIFILHFASGGTLLDFDPQKVKVYFKKLYKEGTMVVRTLKSGNETIPSTIPKPRTETEPKTEVDPKAEPKVETQAA